MNNIKIIFIKNNLIKIIIIKIFIITMKIFMMIKEDSIDII
jgi:hypothetical protein